jgi:hypothetical protein
MLTPPRKLTWVDDLILGLTTYYLTSLLVVLGVIFGHDFLKAPPHNLDGVGPNPDLITCFARYDGQHYKHILENGYEYYPDRQSTIAFFPAYPLTARFLAWLTGWPSEVALLVTAHIFLAAAFVLFAAYARQRFRDQEEAVQYAVVAFGLFPTTFFFRMAYSESMFVCLTIAAMLSMERRWPVLVIATIIGAATATRAAGIALVPALLLHLWQRRTSVVDFATQTIYALPISCWGILAFTAYQWSAFEDPLAWAKAHSHWRLFTAPSWGDKLLSLVTLEPVWSMFLPDSPRYWGKWEWHGNPIFSLLLANPVLFIFTVAVILLGVCKRFLTGPEAILSTGLLGLAYVGRGYDNLMLSSGRFCAVVVPFYLIAGHCIGRLPPCIGTLLFVSAGFFLANYSGLFARGYQLF